MGMVQIPVNMSAKNSFKAKLMHVYVVLRASNELKILKIICRKNSACFQLVLHSEKEFKLV